MRSLLAVITYDTPIDVTTAEAMADSLRDGEGVAAVTVSLMHEPVVRINEADSDDDEPECNCMYKDDPYKAPEQHARTCPVWKLAGLDE
jgi:hypothetical protein